MSEHGGSGAQPSGLGSQGGGGGPPHANAAGNSAGVTNQSILALDPSVHTHLHPHQHRALNKIQLEFARDVSQRAADAYQQTLEVLNASEGPSPSIRGG